MREKKKKESVPCYTEHQSTRRSRSSCTAANRNIHKEEKPR